jgi:hypothetical protein
VIDEFYEDNFYDKIVFCRYNSTILAYGQTGSGKSFTMQEDPDHIGMQEDSKRSGSYRSVEDPDPAKPV